MARNRRRRDSAQVTASLKQSGARIFRAVLTVVLGVALALGIVVGGQRAYSWFTSSPTFAIKTIRVHGNRRAAGDELINLSGLAVGRNLFLSDMEAASAGVSDSPWVKSVSVRRQLPDTVSIEVVEREPRLVVALDHLYLADAEGALFKRAGTGDDLDLPVVTGLSRADVSDHRSDVEARLRDLLSLVDDYRERELPAKAGAIEEINADGDDLTLTLGKASVSVLLGESPYDEKLDKLVTLYGELARRGVHASVIHLENRAAPDRVAVRLADATVARPAPRPAAPSSH